MLCNTQQTAEPLAGRTMASYNTIPVATAEDAPLLDSPAPKTSTKRLFAGAARSSAQFNFSCVMRLLHAIDAT